MAYGRRTYTRRRGRGKASTTSLKKIRYKPGTSATQKHQIYALKKQINAVQKIASGNSYKIMHRYNVTGSLVQPFISAPLILPSSGWANVFGDPSETLGGKYTGGTMHVEWYLTSRTEHSRIDATVFIASPKNQKVVNETGGSASDNCSGLVNGRDFILYGGKALLNKARFHVARCSRQTLLPIVTESAGTEYINDQTSNRRTHNMKSNLVINNRTSSWNTVDGFDLRPGMRWHIYVFSNNVSTLEGSPALSCNCFFTGRTSG